jgi:uncharacterized protein (DUF2147 family)
MMIIQGFLLFEDDMRRQWLAWCMIVSSVAHAYPLVGVWSTVDEKTSEKRADVQFVLSGDELTGTIVHRYVKPGDPTLCAHCPGAFKDKPIQGLQFIWGLKEEQPGVWDHGKLLDPRTGKIYHVKLVKHGDVLHVRGYLGMSWIGRTQKWVPAKT